MIKVGMYSAGATEAATPKAILSCSDKGKTIKIETDDDNITKMLGVLTARNLELPGRMRVSTANPQVWLEALPNAVTYMMYDFRILDENVLISTNIEEEVNGNDESDENDGKEDDTSADGGNEGDGDPDSDGDDILNPNG